ncbi:CDP-diacylglycerol--glycerol-3-phosphate 3-phosphatidyltransferase [Aliikangiella coralliicola]|uniref:CDP-diacylglycerol--glycerol-3-phosphate 3-phosphatidyltransferase n=1 Tax=Aliikangiella coralliicola TaxID=2592383 RepID=A0A545UAJ3_9GAMM|nr:CDP-diacylglycerol--glycerol-3-phosphate 3-phosphatidyltransferase [Aliikangiella coralliicola]TQV86479.1 CDP-diacylglycerol--glycerol-3-phosphate 3-phosphatidyltransferase [Aliikangiella coralliicola]
MNIANLLTSFRIICIPLLVFFFYLPVTWGQTTAALIFAVVGWTDWFDGWVARKFDMQSPLGEFLDPVADKLMVAASLVLLVEQHATIWIAAPALVIISREITVSALREWMAEYGERSAIKVVFIAKVKTLMQLSAIFFLLLAGGEPEVTSILEHSWLYIWGYIFLYVAVGLTLWSMYIYMKVTWPLLVSAKFEKQPESSEN